MAWRIFSQNIQENKDSELLNPYWRDDSSKSSKKGCASK